MISLCPTGDRLCGLHGVHVPGDHPGPRHLLPYASPVILEQEALQQGVQRDRWYV